uniref:Pleiotropic regulator 1 n=1 Tax=Cricetulus griseus TaxID=10029 RepID=A0A8C2MB03_CRIGR
MAEEVQKHFVHTLVFRSLKRTHDIFCHKRKMAIKLHYEYGPVLHMPTSKENFKKKGPQNAADSYPVNQGQDVEYLVTGTHLYPPGTGVALIVDTKIQRMPSESAAQSLAVSLPNQARVDANHTAGPTAMNSMIMEAGNTKNSALMAKKSPTMPKPQWHPPEKLYRVISGHLFVTGSSDTTSKIWDLASGKLKLSFSGHISTVRGVIVSTRSPYLFSCGEDKQMKCWDLEYNKVIPHYLGHLSAVFGLDLNPTIDVLVTCSRDSTARIWDVRTKASVHTLSGHTNAVATVRCQAAEPQIITGIRAVVLHLRHYTFSSRSPDNIKQWKFPDGGFIQNLSGHNAIINTLKVNADRVLVSGANNGTMYFWDWRTRYNCQCVHAAVHCGSLDSESGIFACAFDQSESWLLTAEADKTIKVYSEDKTATEEAHPVSWKPEIIKRKRF